MTWQDHWNKPRRKPWPSEVAQHYHDLNKHIATLSQVNEWMLDDVDIEFCENLQAVGHRVLAINRQLWAAKPAQGTERWGLYVLRCMISIKEEIPKAMQEYERACHIEVGNGEVKRRCIIRAFNSVARVQEAIDKVNPPKDIGSAEELSPEMVEQQLEQWQLRRHGVAMKNCKKCGKRISTQLKECPYCGAKNPYYKTAK